MRVTSTGKPIIYPALGEGFSGNGDFIGTNTSDTDEGLNRSGHTGPTVTSVVRAFDEDPAVTIATPTFAGADDGGAPRGSAGFEDSVASCGPWAQPSGGRWILPGAAPHPARSWVVRIPAGSAAQAWPDELEAARPARRGLRHRARLGVGTPGVAPPSLRWRPGCHVGLRGCRPTPPRAPATPAGRACRRVRWPLQPITHVVVRPADGDRPSHSAASADVAETPGQGVVSPFGEVHGYRRELRDRCLGHPDLDPLPPRPDRVCRRRRNHHRISRLAVVVGFGAGFVSPDLLDAPGRSTEGCAGDIDELQVRQKDAFRGHRHKRLQGRVGS